VRPARLIAVVVLAVPLSVTAGRPLTTDDAAILEDKACQIESWIDRGRDASAGWFVPSCNFGAGVEWQMGFTRSRENGEYQPAEAYAQAKTILRSARDDSPWSLGMTLGLSDHRNQVHSGWNHPYVLLPLSISVEAVTIHLQPGWARDREPHRNLAVWGVAGEFAASERVTYLAEVFGENREKPFVRAGGRWTAIKDRLDLDLTYVTRPAGTREERYVSLGLTWQIGKSLP
jgi:hypothetical protein